jgi:hypothetical protein
VFALAARAAAAALDALRAICSRLSGDRLFARIGAMAKFERAPIQERARAGLRNARAKGKKLGRPRVYVDTDRVNGLRASGASWRTIAEELGVGLGTVHRLAQERSKSGCAAFTTINGIGCSEQSWRPEDVCLIEHVPYSSLIQRRTKTNASIAAEVWRGCVNTKNTVWSSLRPSCILQWCNVGSRVPPGDAD